MIRSYDWLVEEAAKRGFIFAWDRSFYYVWTLQGETVYTSEDTNKIARWFQLHDAVSWVNPNLKQV